MSGLKINKQIEQVFDRYFDSSGVTDHLALFSEILNSDNKFFSCSCNARTRY